MTPDFQGRVVLVTGAARGIGDACATRFADCGATVIRTDRDDADLTQLDQVNQLFARVAADFGRLDVLVANAGVLYNQSVLQSGEQDWEECLAINLRATWWCARAAHPLLRATQGNIVTIASAQALRPGRRSFPYSVAKGGLLSLTRSLAVEFAPDIRVNAIIPGQIESVRTAGFFDAFPDPSAAQKRVLQSFPLRRLGKPEDIARAVCFLASDDASYITGSILHVDGGRHAAAIDLSDLEGPA